MGFISAVNATKITLVCLILYNSVSLSFSWISVASFITFLVVGYFFEEVDDEADQPKRPFPLRKPADPRLTSTQRRDIEKSVHQMMTYDAANSQAVMNFQHIQLQSQCIFAKNAKVWGSADCPPHTSLEDLVFRSLGSWLEFCMVFPYLGLDGFVFQLPEEFGQDVKVFGEAVRRVLTALALRDPAGPSCMEKANIDRRGWVFSFNRITFFVTTFAPVYPETHSRYGFLSPFPFILLQPEISFLQHNLPIDSVHTNWEKPANVRDRIRVAFRNAGRRYFIRDTLYYPMVHDIVRPLEYGDNFFPWWEKPKENSQDQKDSLT